MKQTNPQENPEYYEQEDMVQNINEGKKEQNFDLDKQIINDIEDIQKINEDLFDQILQKNFGMPNQLQEDLVFSKVVANDINKENNATILIEGEIGNGKSTTGIKLLYFHSQDKGIQFDPKDAFKFGRQVERVTSSVHTKQVGDIKVIDTPGTNDFQSTLSDYDIQKMKYQCVNQLFSDPNEGISCIVQCAMADSGGRLRGTSIDNMARTFHSLTFSNPTFDPKVNGGPKICVIFTNFSQFYIEDDDIGVPGLESEAVNDQDTMFSDRVDYFKQNLAQKLYEDLNEKQPLKEIQSKVNKILPFKNFYTFKIFHTNETEKNEEERKELLRLISDAQNHGKQIVQNFDFSKSMICLPVSFTVKESQNLKEKIDSFFKLFVNNSAEIYKNFFNQQISNLKMLNEGILKCQIIDQIQNKCDLIYKAFTEIIEEKPYLLIRLPLTFDLMVSKLNDYFPLYLQKVTMNEIVFTYLKKIDEKAYQQIKDLKETHSKKTSDLREQHIKETKKLNEEHDKQTRRQRESEQQATKNLNNKFDDLKKNHDNLLQTTREKHSKEMSIKCVQYEAKESQLQIQHSKELASEKEKYQMQKKLFEHEILSKLDNQTKESDAEIMKLKELFGLEKKELLEQNSNFQDNLKKEYRNYESQMKKQVEMKDSQIEKRDQQIKTLQTDYVKQIKKLEKQVQAKERKIDQLKRIESEDQY